MKSLYFSLILFILIFPLDLKAQNFWQQTNGPEGGNIQHISISPDGSVFVWKEFKGMYRSSDNGESWVKLGLNVYVYELAFHNNGVYAGTSSGVYYSSNNGDSWSYKGLEGNLIQSIGINSKGYIFVCGVSIEQVDYHPYERAAYRSTDNGNSWTRIVEGLSAEHLMKLLITPDDNIYIGTLESNNAGCVFKSTNNGDFWEHSGSTGNVNSLVSDSTGNIYAGTQNGLSYYNRLNWTDIISFSNSEIIAGVSSSGKIYAAVDRQNIFYSSGDLDNWECITNDLNENINTFGINPDGNIFVCTSTGVFRTTNNGIEWQEKNNGLVFSEVSSLCITPNGKILSGASGSTFFSINNGDSWNKLSNGLENISGRSFTISPNGYIYTSSSWSNYLGSPGNRNNWGIYRSADDGITWQKKDTGLQDSIINSLASNSYGYIFAGTQRGIYRTTDNGENWVSISDDITWYGVYCIAINSANHIFAENDGKLYRSIDNGDTWIQLNVDIHPYISSIKINSDDHIFFSSVHGDLYRSTDNGEVWEQKNDGLLNSTIRCLIITKNDILIAGSTGSGIFCSTNNGESWFEMNDGLTDIDVLALAENPDGYIFAGTHGGVFRSIDTTISQITSIKYLNTETPSFYSLEQNFPNPFNPSTKIKFRIPLSPPLLKGEIPIHRDGGFVTLKVYDILGREVATLVNDEKPAGEYEVEFNAGKLSSGIYFYVLSVGSFGHADNFIDIKKMILMK
jgi:photosystem II stability/assembly factor-like uncharacterized protein